MKPKVKRYTYEDLMQIGASRATPEDTRVALRAVQASDSNMLFYVLKDGAPTWAPLASITPEQRKKWEYMTAGIRVVMREACEAGNEELANRVEGYLSYAAPAPAVYSQTTLTHDLKQERALQDSVTGNGDGYARAAEKWNIPRSLPIASYAAMFYLLYARSERGDPRAKQELSYFMARVEPWIMRYLDMATGGEARYMASMAIEYRKGTAPEAVEKEVMESKLISWSGGKAVLHHKNGQAVEIPSGRDRPHAWMAWHDIRQELGMDALNWCIIAHLESKESSYGGPLWANAAYLIRLRELKQRSPEFLVDQAFSLQHNGGEIFNKLWDVSNLVNVLNEAFAGKTQRLPKYLTLPEHKALYNRVCVEATPFDLQAQQGQLELRVKRVAKFDRSSVLGLSSEPITVEPR